MSLEITEELIARQLPEAQAIIRALLAKIRELQDRLNQSPRNSSSPPGSEHPHAKLPRRKPLAARLRGGQTVPRLLCLRQGQGGCAVHGSTARPRAVRCTGRCGRRAEDRDTNSTR